MSSTSLRLVFEYERDTIRLISTSRVDMIAPPPQRLQARDDEAGHWVELRDGSDRPLYRRLIQEPIPSTVETVSEDGERLTRVPIEPGSGQFSIVVPDVPGAKAILLVDSMSARPGITRFDLAGFDLSSGS